jgi:hypothetical protein
VTPDPPSPLADDDLDDAAGRSPRLAALLAAARRPAEPGELVGEDATVAAMTRAITAVGRGDRGRVVRRVLVAKTTIAAAITLGVATAAAATGVAVGWVAPHADEPPQRHAPAPTTTEAEPAPPPHAPTTSIPEARTTTPTTRHPEPDEHRGAAVDDRDDEDDEADHRPGPPPGQGRPDDKGPPPGLADGSGRDTAPGQQAKHDDEDDGDP